MYSEYTGREADGTQVSRIKERVEEKEGIPPAQQRLIYGGKQMYVPLALLPSPPYGYLWRCL